MKAVSLSTVLPINIIIDVTRIDMRIPSKTPSKAPDNTTRNIATIRYSTDRISVFKKAYKWALVTVVCAIPLVACSSQPVSQASAPARPSIELTEQVEADIASLYDCAWYYHLIEEKDLGNLMLDEAVEVSKAAGVEGQDIMGLYGLARRAQKERALPVAIEIAKQKKQDSALKLIDTNQDAAVQPTTDDMNEAHLQIYKEKCIPMGEQFSN